MRMMIKMLAGAAGLATVAAAPAAAQYYPYGYSGYSGYNGYSAYGANSNVAAQQCSAAVQNRLYNRTSIGSILGSLVGLPTNVSGRIVSITSSTPTRNGMRIRGLASSGLASLDRPLGLDLDYQRRCSDSSRDTCQKAPTIELRG